MTTTAIYTFYGRNYLLTKGEKDGKMGAFDQKGIFYYIATSFAHSDWDSLYEEKTEGEDFELDYWKDLSYEVKKLFR
jgi:hypothetical protein